jgi:hypothetical protein
VHLALLFGHHLTRLSVVILAVGILPAAVGETRSSQAGQAQRKFAQVADKISREGVPAKLPPHISTLLGISKEEDCPVKQKVIRSGKMVQGFDVSVKNEKDVVLFVVDESASNQTLYLTSPTGTLRKLVSVTAGVGAAARITAQDKKAFDKEKQFWIEQVLPAAASK